MKNNEDLTIKCANPTNIGQIWKLGTVLESANTEDSKTVPIS